MRKFIRIAAAALCAAVLLAALAVGLSHIAYGRSLKASLYEIILRRRFATDRTPESEIDRLEARRAAGESPYVIPARLKFRVDVDETERNGMQVFRLNRGGGGATVVYLHGGAYINAFNDYQWRFMDRLARETGCEIVAPAYHLAPFAGFAQAYEDLAGLWRDLRAAEPNRRFLLMGDSAGGGLALGVAEYLAGGGDPLPERLILFSPWVDVSMDNPDIENYVPVDPILHLELVKIHGKYWAGGDTRNWMASPLFGDMTGLPPVTIYCGTRELLYPDLLLAREALEAAGVDLTFRVGWGLNHDYPLMPLPEADRAFREIASLVRG